MRPARPLEERFGPVVALVTVVGFAIRVVYTLVYNPTPTGDGATFLELARNLAGGDGYALAGADGVLHASASHPPLLPIVVAGAHVLGIDGVTAQRIVVALISSLAVVLTAATARRVGGPVVGVVSGAVAALHPVWIQPAGVFFAEPLYLTAVAAVLWTGVRLVDGPSPSRAAALGIAVALAALTRSEATAFVVLAAVLAATVAGRWRERVALAATVVAAAAVLLVPWVVRNHEAVGATGMSTNLGVTLAGSNCDETYPGGPDFGTWSTPCAFIYASAHTGLDEVARDEALRQDALDYIGDRPGELTRVVPARVGRLWGVFAPGAQLRFDRSEGERQPDVQLAAQVAHWLLLVPTAVGAVSLARRNRRQAAVVLTPLLLATAIAVAFYGSTRMRTVAEPSIAVLAAIGGVHLCQALRSRSRPVTV